MKKVIFLIATGIFSLNLLAGNPGDPNDMGDKYCTKMKDGKLTVMHSGSELTADVTLTNGTVIKPDGTIIKKDGTQTMMKSGECVNKEGKTETTKSKNKSMEKTNEKTNEKSMDRNKRENK